MQRRINALMVRSEARPRVSNHDPVDGADRGLGRYSDLLIVPQTVEITQNGLANPSRVEGSGVALDFLQSQIGRARPEEADRRHHDAHRRGDENEDAEGAGALEHEGDDEG